LIHCDPGSLASVLTILTTRGRPLIIRGAALQIVDQAARTSMPDQKSAPATRARRPQPSTFEDQGSGLVDLSEAEWLDTPSEQQMELLNDIKSKYFRYVEELYVTANLCVDKFEDCSGNYLFWRRMVILGTGVVAIVNLLATHNRKRETPDGTWITYAEMLLPSIAAICALVLSIFANLESFYNWSDKAQVYRESRELFLDAGREFERAWDVYVRPHFDNYEAWKNSVELYRRVTVKDRELRGAFRELTKSDRPRRG
jgi:hypothetical protein